MTSGGNNFNYFREYQLTTGYYRGLRERWIRESRCYFFCHTPKKWGYAYPLPVVSYACGHCCCCCCCTVTTTTVHCVCCSRQSSASTHDNNDDNDADVSSSLQHAADDMASSGIVTVTSLSLHTPGSLSLSVCLSVCLSVSVC